MMHNFKMLKYLRSQKTRKRIFILLAVVIIPAFLFWGVMLSQDDEKNKDFLLGRVDGKTITVSEYLKSYRAVQHQVQLFYGEKAGELNRALNLKGQAWDRILLLNYAKKQRLKTGDPEVVDWISKQFSLKGKFDGTLYKRYVEAALRSNPREFEEELRDSLTVSKISEKIRSGISLTEEELKKSYDEAHKKRALVYGFLSWESQKDSVKVSEEELQKIYSIVKDNLTDPAQGDKKLNYEESRAELTKIMTRDSATKEAVKKLGEIKKELNGQNFEEILAKNHVQVQKADPFKSGDVLPLVGAASAKIFEDKIASLKEGETSEPFGVSGGAVIVKVVKDYPAEDGKFNEEKEEFRKKLLDEKFEAAMQKLLAELRNQLKLNLETMQKLFPSEEPQ